MSVTGYDTDMMKLTRAVRKDLDQHSTPHESGCILYDPERTRRIFVETKFRGVRAVSVLRVAWAIANPHDHLGEDDYAIHTCGQTGDPGTIGCCVNGDHLVKGNREMLTATALHTRMKFEDVA